MCIILAVASDARMFAGHKGTKGKANNLLYTAGERHKSYSVLVSLY